MQLLNTSEPSPVLDEIKQDFGPFFLSPPYQIFLLPLDGYTQLFPDEPMPDYERFNLLTDMLEKRGSRPAPRRELFFGERRKSGGTVQSAGRL